jgi:primosomal protein N' (replication factor Y)
MQFVDVVFPLNLGPLTYSVSESCAARLKTGMLVSAPLKQKVVKGVMIGRPSAIPAGKVKEILDVHGDTPLLDEAMIRLFRWMSDYYLAREGLVLKHMVPREVFYKVKSRQGRQVKRKEFPFHTISVGQTHLEEIRASVKEKTYKAFLLHAPSTAYEYSFLLELLSATRNVLVLLPEIVHVTRMYSHMERTFGERVCILHSGLSRGARTDAIERVLSGVSDIVIGTRSAVCAPMKKISCIAVLHEQNPAYKEESGIFYSGRDVAVMRGFFGKATVILSSACPSVESRYNCELGKYIFLMPKEGIKRPKIDIVDMRFDKAAKQGLSLKIIRAAQKCIESNGKVLFVMNRRGYSSFLQCAECDFIEECPKCHLPVVFHKDDMSMKCHLCGWTEPHVPASCKRCGGYHIQMLGAGTQKIQEDIERALGSRTLRLDSDKAAKRSEMEGLLSAAFQDDMRIIVGTKLAARRVGSAGGFSMAAYLNADLSLHLPDFRSTERMFQEIITLADQVEPDGTLFVQTRMPSMPLFRYLKKQDYSGFFREELRRRRSLRYPPVAKLILITCISKSDLTGELSEIIDDSDTQVETLGPSVVATTQGKYECKVLLKSTDRIKLRAIAKKFVRAFKKEKDITLRVNVDPVTV